MGEKRTAVFCNGYFHRGVLKVYFELRFTAAKWAWQEARSRPFCVSVSAASRWRISVMGTSQVIPH
jgi:hypothetical protein